MRPLEPALQKPSSPPMSPMPGTEQIPPVAAGWLAAALRAGWAWLAGWAVPSCWTALACWVVLACWAAPADDPAAPTAAWAIAGDPSTPATTTAMMTPGTVRALRVRAAARRKSLAIMGS